MPRNLCLRVPLAAASVFLPVVLSAQNVEIWKEGTWVVQSPTGGGCGTLPLLQAKGPGSIFDAGNTSALKSFERALPAAIAKACPGVREVILVSGRGRRLMKATEPAAGASANVPPGTLSQTALTQTTPQTGERPADIRSAAPQRANPQVLTTRSALPPSGGETLASPHHSAAAAPSLAGTRSSLRSVSAARSIEDKCEVLHAWLESGKAGGNADPSTRFRQSRQDMMAVFRDEAMTAVFGTPYDRTENRWRMEQYEKVISRCLGVGANRPNPFTHQPNRALMQYAQQFQQYRQVLDSAFLGTPGPFEPSNITRYVQQVRSQVEWANQAMSAAASASASQEGFDRIRQQRQAVNAQLSLLSSADRAQVGDYLAQRQAALAPAIVEEWFRQAGSTPKGTASAKALQSSYSGISPVISSLESSSRTAYEQKFRTLADSLIAEPLQAQVAELRSIPATLAGMLQAGAWKTKFDTSFSALRGLPGVSTAEQEFIETRARVFTGALPSWIQQVQAIPADGAAITAKRREMEILFPSRQDRSGQLFAQFETPLKAKEDQLRLKVEAEMRKQQQEAEAAALKAQQNAPAAPARESMGPARASAVRERPGPNLTESAFLMKGVQNAQFFLSMYKGDFDQIRMSPDDMKFADLYSTYLTAYGKRCDAFLPQDRKVELTRQRCSARWVGAYGADKGCADWETVGTGVFADPELHEVYRRLSLKAAVDAPRNVLNMMKAMTQQRDPFAAASGMVNDAITMTADMSTVVGQNGCASAALTRFEENLTLFAQNKRPIPLGASGPKLSAIDPLPGIAFRDQDYKRLVEDLVADQARGWAVNRFHQGSVTDVSVSSRDGKGRPAKIGAGYIYDGFSGNGARGTVSVTFDDGRPNCIYFFDMPGVCRTPSRQVVSAYESGAYQPH